MRSKFSIDADNLPDGVANEPLLYMMSNKDIGFKFGYHWNDNLSSPLWKRMVRIILKDFNDHDFCGDSPLLLHCAWRIKRNHNRICCDEKAFCDKKRVHPMRKYYEYDPGECYIQGVVEDSVHYYLRTNFTDQRTALAIEKGKSEWYKPIGEIENFIKMCNKKIMELAPGSFFYDHKALGYEEPFRFPAERL